jgi:hypothetical protein
VVGHGWWVHGEWEGLVGRGTGAGRERSGGRGGK